MPHFLTKMMASPYASPSPPEYPMERKLKKPLMEKRRRARMNECLEQLKHLLLHISPNHRTKLEKADILEMTVAYLNQMQQPSSPSTSFDNNAIYQQSYAEGFSVAASACLTYLQNILPTGEFTPQTQQFKIGLIQHLQNVMSNHVNASTEDSGTTSSHSIISHLSTSLQNRSPSLTSGTCVTSNYLSNPVYSRTPYITYHQPNTFYGTPVLRTAISSTPSQSNILSISKDLVPRPVAVVGAQPALSGFYNNHRKKGDMHSEPMRRTATAANDTINEGIKEFETVKNVKVWRPF